MQQPCYPYPQQQPSRTGLPIWAWVLIGCGCVGVFFMVIMGALLFPVFSQARERARQAACMSNVKQMSMAVQLYLQDYDTRFPRATDWMDTTMPYVKNMQVFQCPSVARLSSTPGEVPTIFGYAYNQQVSARLMKDISNPALLPNIYDSNVFARNANDPGSSLPYPGRHSRGNNVAYTDGHAKWVREPGSQPGGSE